MIARPRRTASSGVMATVFADVGSDVGLDSDDDFAAAENETIHSSSSDSSDEEDDIVGPLARTDTTPSSSNTYTGKCSY